MSNRIKYIFFDVGYTLVDESKVWEKRCIEQSLTDEARALDLSADDIFNEIVKASLSLKPQYRTVVKKFAFKEVAPYRHELEELYPKAKQVLEKLSHEYKLGIIANQSDGLTYRLEEWGILKYFSLVISSWDYQVMKPDKKIFEIALEKAGCEPHEAVMIGDRLDNDIYPAKEVGMKTIWIKQGFGGMQKAITDAYKPDFEINSLKEILGCVGSVTLIKANVENAKLICKMQVEAFSELYEKYQDTETNPACEHVEKITEKLRQPFTYYYLIQRNEINVGAIRVVDKKDGTAKRISPIFVLEKHRNQGVAQKAIKVVEEIHGCKNWELDTISEEQGNCHLYEKLGYRKFGENKKINDKLTLVHYFKR